VIFGIDPENWHDLHAMRALDPMREFHRRQRFEQRKERSAEQSGLLAGDDHDGARIGKVRGLCTRPLGCAASFLL
jgi:hypothetical protein